MNRILLVVWVAALMAALMAAKAAPAFAQARHLSGPGDVQGVPCEIKGVITPSDHTNLQCKYQHEDPNKGVSGGGGATVEKRVGEENTGGELVPVRAHAVHTPSGNGKLQGHLYPAED